MPAFCFWNACRKASQTTDFAPAISAVYSKLSSPSYLNIFWNGPAVIEWQKVEGLVKANAYHVLS
jgi:hypothetical protein